MARLVGTELDDALYQRLAGQDLDAVAGKAIVVVSVDEAGRPHPALLSYFEIIAKDRHNIRLATYGTTSVARAARRRAPLTLALFDAGLACYLKGTSSELAPAMTCTPENAKVNVRVEQVLSDDPDPRFEAEAGVTGGITYFEPHPASARARAARVLAELLE
jgi:hypothetical protein